MPKTKIAWTDETFNPLTGCSKVSDGCFNCWADEMAQKLQMWGSPRYSNGFKLTLHWDMLEIPYKWKKPKKVFSPSMSDLFHKYVPEDFILKFFKVMNETQHIQWQICTKRPERFAELNDKIDWTDNIWLGITVESYKYLDRIDLLRNTGAKIKWVSFEPLIDNVNSFDLADIDWVVVGGESGKKHQNIRPMKKEWVDYIYETARMFNTAFFFKQWGGHGSKKGGNLYNDKLYEEFPTYKIKYNNTKLGAIVKTIKTP